MAFFPLVNTESKHFLKGSSFGFLDNLPPKKKEEWETKTILVIWESINRHDLFCWSETLSLGH